MDKIFYNIQFKIEENRIADLICEGIENGIGYWAKDLEFIEPKKIIRTDRNVPIRYYYPLYGGSIKLVDYYSEDKKVLELNEENIKNGLKVMAEKYPSHFGDWLSDSDDSLTGDVFLQCALFGEVLYG